MKHGSQWDVDYTKKLSINNWIERMNLHCADPYEIGLFGSFEFIGTSITALILPPLADTYGRRYFSIGSMWLTTLVLMLLLVFRTPSIYYIATSINGICIGLK